MEKIKLSLKIPDFLSQFKNRNNYEDFFLKERKVLLTNLGIYADLKKDIVKKAPETVYKLVYKPKNAKLFKDAAGNIKGVFYRDGKILKHARFKEINLEETKNFTQAGGAISSIFTQALLLKIAVEIEEVHKEISDLKKEFSMDRLSKLKSGINQFDHAILVHDELKRTQMITNAIQTLEEGIEINLRNLNSQINSAPDDKINFFTNWNIKKEKSRNAKAKFQTIGETFKGLLLGMKVLAESYSYMNEPEAASKILKENIEKLDDDLIKMASEKARLVPVENGIYAEETWNRFLEIKPNIIENITKCYEFSQKEFESIEIEFKPSDLKELNA